RPVAEGGHRLQQIAPERGQAVFDPRRNGGKYAARNQPVTFEATQCQRQHALGNAADRPAQFVKPQRSAAKPRHHQNRPLVADPGEHVAHRAAVRGQMLVSRFHGCAFLAGCLWVTYLALVTTCQYRSRFLAFHVTSAYRRYPPHYLRFPLHTLPFPCTGQHSIARILLPKCCPRGRQWPSTPSVISLIVCS